MDLLKPETTKDKPGGLICVCCFELIFPGVQLHCGCLRTGQGGGSVLTGCSCSFPVQLLVEVAPASGSQLNAVLGSSGSVRLGKVHRLTQSAVSLS